MFAQVTHQKAAGALLAYTAKTFMPILQPIMVDALDWGFHCDFVANRDVDDVVLTLLTEEMRRNVSKDLPIDVLHMMPSNACQFLQKEQPLQAALLEQYDANVVDLAKIANFYTIVSGDLAPSTKELSDFALLSAEKKQAYYEGIGDIEIVRIHGVVCFNKKELKAYVKEYDKSLRQKPTELCEVYEGYPTWYPEGLSFYEKVVHKWVQLCQTQSIKILITPNHDTKEAHLRAHKTKKFDRTGEWKKRQRDILPQDYEGLFQTKECSQDLIFRTCALDSLQDELISSLQFIQELHSIFTLDTTIALVQSKAKKMQSIQKIALASVSDKQVVLEVSTQYNARARIELRAKDARRRMWLLAFVEIEEIDDLLLLTQSSVVSLERLLALHLDGGYKKA